MCPACASPPSMWGHQSVTRRDSARNVATAVVVALALPPWPFTRTTLSAHSAERTSSTIIDAVTGAPIDSVPANAACSPLDVTDSVGPTTTRELAAERYAHKASATIESVPSGR